MGKLIISTQMTLDGVITVGEWFNQYGEHDWHGSAGQASLDQLRANVLSFGFGDFAYQLVEHGLADELRYWVNPYSWGEGERPFHGKGPLRFELVSTTTFDRGIVLLSYRPKRTS